MITLNALPEPFGIGTTQFFLSGNHDIIIETSEDIGLDAEGFADLTFDAVTLNGRTLRFQGDPEAIVAHFIGNSKNSALTQSIHLCLIEEATILPRIM